jgi:transcriptional regulator with XRE-family HTH domain
MIGTELKKAREKAGLSQRKLSEKAGVRQCQISDIEHNKLVIDHIHLGTLRKLCDALHLTPNDLLGYAHTAHE